jgi:hypothetical protein
MEPFTERHASKIAGVLSCYDRVVITGTCPAIGHAKSATTFLYTHHVRIFDYAQWAQPFRQELRANAERLAHDNGLEIEFIRKKNFRKEERIKRLLETRGTQPGLVHIFSAMEPCDSYKPWHDKASGKTYLTWDPAKCLHYYFYFIDPELGLCYLRVPTWAPFRLQFYYNGHNELAKKLDKHGIAYTLADNAFLTVADWDKAQRLADAVRPDRLHKRLDRFARTYCPVIRHFGSFHWSLMQLEYATDIVFRRQADLRPIYEELVRTAIHAVKPEHVAPFLGRKLTAAFEGELGNDFHTRIEGTCIKHQMRQASIKMYDKHGLILRIETTANDVSFFKHYRKVEHRDGPASMTVAPVKKSIYSLIDLLTLMADSNRRYLEFLSAIDDPTAPLHDLDKLSRPVHEGDRTYRGFNLFHGDDLDLFRALLQGHFNISGFTNRQLRAVLPTKTGRQLSALLKRLYKHGLIKKIRRTYKYYLTALGKRAAAAALKLREMTIIPLLRGRLAI